MKERQQNHEIHIDVCVACKFYLVRGAFVVRPCHWTLSRRRPPPPRPPRPSPGSGRCPSPTLTHSPQSSSCKTHRRHQDTMVNWGRMSSRYKVRRLINLEIDVSTPTGRESKSSVPPVITCWTTFSFTGSIDDQKPRGKQTYRVIRIGDDLVLDHKVDDCRDHYHSRI